MGYYENEVDFYMYKLIALDLDGTLNNDQREITPKTRTALLAAQQQGARVVLASGRQPTGMVREIAALELERYKGLLCAYNGGYILDAQTRQPLYEQAMPSRLVTPLLEHLAQFPIMTMVDDGIHLYTTDADGFQVQDESCKNHLQLQIVENLADAVDFAPRKMLMAAPEVVLVPLLAEISGPFSEQLAFAQTAPFYYEVMEKNVSKANGLAHLCQRLGITADEVMAFGDAQNDLSMLRFAGLGVAMGNACEELKMAADEVTLSNNEDGIAYTLARYFDVPLEP